MTPHGIVLYQSSFVQSAPLHLTSLHPVYLLQDVRAGKNSAQICPTLQQNEVL